MFRLERAVHRHADVVSLFLRQGGELGAEFVQVQSRHFLVQFFIQTIHSHLPVLIFRMSICAIVWLVKLLDITKLGWPVAQARLINRPSASR